MNTKIEKNTKKLRTNWVEAKGRFTSKDINEAYLKGQEDKMKSLTEKVKKRLFANLNLAQKLSEEIQIECKEKFKLPVKRMFLKIEGINYFETLIVVSEKSYISDSFNDVYMMSSEIKKANNNSDFKINFVFTSINSTKELNSSAVFSNGYLLEYGKANKKPTSRTAQ